MQNGIQHACRVLLVIYGIYSFSPLCISISGTDDAGLIKGDQAQAASIGILWLSVAFNELIGDSVMNSAPEDRAGVDDAQVAFIQKKRTINRNRLNAKPVVHVAVQPQHQDNIPTRAYRSYDIPHDLIHQHADGYFSLSTGISPPRSLS